MSTSTKPRRLCDVMLEAIVDLTRARPHMRTSAHYTPAEQQIFNEGYYTGCVFALRVAEAAIERFNLYRAERRAAAKEKRRA
jgi:hypothetical protein